MDIIKYRKWCPSRYSRSKVGSFSGKIRLISLSSKRMYRRFRLLRRYTGNVVFPALTWYSDSYYGEKTIERLEIRQGRPL